jgi:hypothetical protein
MERSLHRVLVIAKYLIFKVGSLGDSGEEKLRCCRFGFLVKVLSGGFCDISDT